MQLSVSLCSVADPDPFDTDPDLYHFKETQKVFFVKFSLPGNFVVLIRVAYGSGSLTPGVRIRILKNDTDPYGSATLPRRE